MEKLKTVKKECKIEFEEKKSKFIGYIKPVFSKEEAEDYIKYIKIFIQMQLITVQPIK